MNREKESLMSSSIPKLWSRSSVLAGAVVLAGGLAALLAAGCSQDASSQNGAGASASGAPGSTVEEPPRNVRVLALERGGLTEHLLVSGPLHPARGANISAEESGVIAEVLRDKGAYVRRGEPVLALDRRILEAEKQSAEANETLHGFNEERTKSLFEEKSVSGQEMLLVHTQAAQARAQAEIARLRYEKATFPAPFSGIVSERFVEVGEMVAPGTVVARIIDPYRLELNGAITERDVPYVNKGAAVQVSVEGLAAPVGGEVAWVGFEADLTTGKFPVEIAVDNRSLELRSGVLARARIEKQVHDDALAIPRDAVLATPDGPTVFVAEDGRARRRSVILGFDDGLLVQVRSGLEPGDELIVRGHRDLTDGTPITIQERSDRRDGSIATDPESVRQRATGAGIEVPGGVR